MSVVHEITRDEEGRQHGTDGTHVTTLLDPDGRMFKRRAVKGVGTEGAQEVCWLVVELNGVRVYQNGDHVVVTTQDIYP